MQFYETGDNQPRLLLSEHHSSVPVTSYDSIIRKSHLFFFTKDYLLEYPKPLYPNCIELGGLTASDANPLTGEWLDYVESASYGVIVVSFGSAVNYLPNNKFALIRDGLRAVKYQVIWRVGKMHD